MVCRPREYSYVDSCERKGQQWKECVRVRVRAYPLVGIFESCDVEDARSEPLRVGADERLGGGQNVFLVLVVRPTVHILGQLGPRGPATLLVVDFLEPDEQQPSS
jgi:hypothetical protein